AQHAIERCVRRARFAHAASGDATTARARRGSPDPALGAGLLTPPEGPTEGLRRATGRETFGHARWPGRETRPQRWRVAAQHAIERCVRRARFAHAASGDATTARARRGSPDPPLGAGLLTPPEARPKVS